MRSLLLCVLAACTNTNEPVAEPVVPAPTPTPPVPVPVPAPAPKTEPVSRDVSAAWMAAVEAKDAKAIEGFLALPFTFYYDDAYTGRRPAACDPVRSVRRIEKAADRTKVAKCIAETVQFTIAHASEPIGIWELDRLPLPEHLRAPFQKLSADHVFVHGTAIASGAYDFTLAVPQVGDTKATALVLTTIRGC